MLIDIDTGREITDVPYKATYKLFQDRLSIDEKQLIFDHLNRMIEGDEIHTAGWMPGADWSGTPFDPIYSKAAQCNHEIAGKIFGLIVWKVMMDRQEKWGSGHYKKDGVPIQSRTYFRLRGGPS